MRVFVSTVSEIKVYIIQYSKYGIIRCVNNNIYILIVIIFDVP